MSDEVVTALVAVAIAIGVAGTVVPLLPGLVLVWAATLVYGLAVEFGTVGTMAFALSTVVAVAGIVAGAVLPHRAAGSGGAARSSIWVGTALGIVGFFVIPVVGLLVGMVTGIFAAELWQTRQVRAAWPATLATLKGFGWAAAAQLAAAVVMAILWVVWVVA
jgi:uncharacterized protein YqgC (DUF456 family)